MRETSIKKDKGNRWVIIIMLLAVVLAFLMNYFVISLARVVGDSMMPLLHENDWILTNRLAYSKEEPKRGDIILFSKEDLDNEIIVKRIVALPFDTIEIKKGSVFINEVLIDVSALIENEDRNVYEDMHVNEVGLVTKNLVIKKEKIVQDVHISNETLDLKKITVPKDCYFVMGDNRQQSIDSRFWLHPFVKKDEIIGKVLFIY